MLPNLTDETAFQLSFYLFLFCSFACVSLLAMHVFGRITKRINVDYPWFMISSFAFLVLAMLSFYVTAAYLPS